jgi:hypothetical protein
VLVGQEHARLDVEVAGLLPDRIEGADEVFALLLRRGLARGGHHRGVRGTVGQNYFCHRPLLSSGLPNGSRILR